VSNQNEPEVVFDSPPLSPIRRDRVSVETTQNEATATAMVTPKDLSSIINTHLDIVNRLNGTLDRIENWILDPMSEIALANLSTEEAMAFYELITVRAGKSMQFISNLLNIGIRAQLITEIFGLKKELADKEADIPIRSKEESRRVRKLKGILFDEIDRRSGVD